VFYGGVNEVGGNKILLDDNGTKIFLDFGKGFSRRAKFFEEYLKPRSANGLVDFIEMGLIPDIEGVYREDLIEMAGRKAAAPQVDAVLVSHAHADHVDYISFLHRDIPIYIGSTCHTILKSIQERAPRDFEREVLDFLPRPSKRGAKPVERKINEFRSGRKFKVGSLEIHPIHVDHSIPGAYGFIIYTSAGPIAYTGDIRPPAGSLYIHSASEPYNEEMVLNQERVDNWLDKFGMERHQIHCSGHAKGPDLFSIVKDIDAGMLFPVHTEHPEMYVRATRKMTVVEEGKAYTL
jgi:ribonuclease J